MRERIPVVVQGQRRRPSRGRVLARGLWSGAELAVTAGLVLLLLVVHQLWWTNREARAGARDQVRALERQWAASGARGEGAGGEGSGEVPAGASPGASAGADPDPDAGSDPDGSDEGAVGESPGPGPPRRSASPPGRTPAPPRGEGAYAVLRIPRLGVVAPVAQGVSRRGVLDKGYVGHYAGTAQPGGPGNFALAGHRNTHGEPFRYINRLRAGDELIVDVRGRRYTYAVGRRLEQTSARDGGVIASVPRSVVHPRYGYDEPGFYITLTTCTPEYTSRYRLVVWGTLMSSAER